MGCSDDKETGDSVMKRLLSVLAVLAALFFGAAAFTAYFLRKEEASFARRPQDPGEIGRADGPPSIFVSGKCSPFDIGSWFLRAAMFFYNHMPQISFYFARRRGEQKK